jgi:hypothetical protein
MLDSPTAPSLTSPGKRRATRSMCCWTRVLVNGVRVFDSKDYVRLNKGLGQVHDRFLPARAAPTVSAAQ